MFELTINKEVYQFHFGMGFMREINKKVGTYVDGLPDVKKNMGLQYYVAGVLDGDVESLIEVLNVANKNQTPRVTQAVLDAYVDHEDTDIDKLFEDVVDFLSKTNATKKVVNTMKEEVAKQRAKQQ